LRVVVGAEHAHEALGGDFESASPSAMKPRVPLMYSRRTVLAVSRSPESMLLTASRRNSRRNSSLASCSLRVSRKLLVWHGVLVSGGQNDRSRAIRCLAGGGGRNNPRPRKRDPGPPHWSWISVQRRYSGATRDGMRLDGLGLTTLPGHLRL
jgi:hypothetical protein